MPNRYQYSKSIPLVMYVKGKKNSVSLNLFISIFFTVSITVCFILFNDENIHWYIFPVALCGVYIGIDVVSWVRGKLNLFDPVGIIACVGYHFFFLAPIMHVSFDHWMRYVIPPNDWRDWLGFMAIINIISIIIYKYSYIFFSKKRKFKTRIINKKKFIKIVAPFLVFSGFLQFFVYHRYGGITGFIKLYEFGEGSSFQGMGWIFMISQSFPILLALCYAVFAKSNNKWNSWTRIIIFTTIFFVLKLLFGGLSGSRSHTIWGLFWLAGIVHLWIRPIPKKMVVVGILFLFLFMYIYGFYKGAGIEGIASALDSESRAELETQTGRTLEATLLGDLARADVQSYILYRIWEHPSDTSLALGKTYLGTIALLVPGRLWRNRPATKLKYGTDIQYGTGSSMKVLSSRVYGLGGEAMINFGPTAIPISYLFLGFIVGRVRGILLSCSKYDSRILIFPFLANVCLVFLVGDSDNALFFLIKNGFIPILLIYLSSFFSKN